MNKEEIKLIIKNYVSGRKQTILNKNGISKTHKGKSYKDKLKAYDQKMHRIFSDKEPKMYNFLINELGNNFTAEQLYVYLYDIDILKYKGRFVSLNRGYEEFKMIGNKIDLSFITTKTDLYNFIILHKSKHFTLNRLKTRTNICENFPEILNINTSEELFLFLTDKQKKYCEICGKPTPFISLYGNRNYNQFCCDKCRQIWWSKQQKENNTLNRMTDTKWARFKEKLSIIAKRNIQSGKWTPNITNSWCRSKIKLKYVFNNKTFQKYMRSSWDAYFQLLHPEFEYETLRILYFNTTLNEYKNYIVDFIDKENKDVYEIKPHSYENAQSNIDKFNALNNWCKTNGYKMHIINEEYFKKQKLNFSLLNYMDDIEKDRLIRLITQNKFIIDYEN